MKTVCFTGHRDVKITRELKNRLMATLEKLIQNGCTDFYAGGAVGWDMLCEAAVPAEKIYRHQTAPYISLHFFGADQSVERRTEASAFADTRFCRRGGICVGSLL